MKRFKRKKKKTRKNPKRNSKKGPQWVGNMHDSLVRLAQRGRRFTPDPVTLRPSRNDTVSRAARIEGIRISGLGVGAGVWISTDEPITTPTRGGETLYYGGDDV